jgi:hypothetical protein
MVWKILIVVAAFLIIMRLGLFFIRTLSSEPPVPQEGELRRVSLKYRCSICGAEVRMTKAGEDLPEPPRHCMEDMDLVAPVE